MKNSTKVDLALAIMIDLARNKDDRPISLARLTDHNRVSVSYMEQVFSILRRQGLICSIRGPGGGYKLGLLPSEISSAAIIEAVEPLNNCLSQRLEADVFSHGALGSFWGKYNNHTKSYFGGVSLQDILDDGDKNLALSQDIPDDGDKNLTLSEENSLHLSE